MLVPAGPGSTSAAASGETEPSARVSAGALSAHTTKPRLRPSVIATLQQSSAIDLPRWRQSDADVSESRRELAQCGVHSVELPEAALDLAIDVAVELRARSALRHQPDQLVDSLELVGEMLDAAHALVAMMKAARHDLASVSGAVWIGQG